MVDRQAQLAEPETMGTPFKEMQLRRHFGRSPFLVDSDAALRGHQPVRLSRHDENGGSVFGRRCVVHVAVNRCRKIGTTRCIVVQYDAPGQSRTGGESHDADAVGSDMPMCGMLANGSDSLFAFGKANRSPSL